jgi:exo-beta-1,3-glucanase (GH17 family)
MSPAELVKCITSVKTLLKGINLGSIKVGTADSWNLWVNGANVNVIRACDIILSNAFSVPPLSPIHLTCP